MIDGLRRGGSGDGPDLEQSPVSLPSRRVSPLGAVGTRAAIAAGLLVLATLIVYLGRSGYRDAARPGQPLNFLGAAYYSAVTLSTTGYGDIVPITSVARLVNTVVITPIRVVFLIVLIGTTLEVLTERTRLGWRLTRWRSKVTGHTVVVGYGSKGRSVLTSLRESGLAAASIVIVDNVLEVTSEANRAGYAAVTGDATRRDVLASAETPAAARLVIVVGRDDTAVLIALTARQLNPALTIVAAVREAENEPLLRQSGADQVVVSSAAAGRLLALSAIEPAAGQVMAELLGWGHGLDLTERSPAGQEVGRPARDACAGLIAVVRDGSLLAVDDPRAGEVRPGDRLVLVSAVAVARPRT